MGRQAGPVSRREPPLRDDEEGFEARLRSLQAAYDALAERVLAYERERVEVRGRLEQLLRRLPVT